MIECDGCEKVLRKGGSPNPNGGPPLCRSCLSAEQCLKRGCVEPRRIAGLCLEHHQLWVDVRSAVRKVVVGALVACLSLGCGDRVRPAVGPVVPHSVEHAVVRSGRDQLRDLLTVDRCSKAIESLTSLSVPPTRHVVGFPPASCGDEVSGCYVRSLRTAWLHPDHVDVAAHEQLHAALYGVGRDSYEVHVLHQVPEGWWGVVDQLGRDVASRVAEEVP